MNNTNVKETTKAVKANDKAVKANDKAVKANDKAVKANDKALFPQLSNDSINNVIATLETNMKNVIGYFKQIASDPNAIKDIKVKNEKTKAMVDGMLKAKAIDKEQGEKILESLIIPEVDSSWGKYPVSSSTYDSFYKEYPTLASKDHDEDCLQSLTLYCLLTRACLYALKQYKQYSKNINENSNVITDRINKENAELFIKRCNSQSKRSGQNYKVGKTALQLTENIDDLLK